MKCKINSLMKLSADLLQDLSSQLRILRYTFKHTIKAVLLTFRLSLTLPMVQECNNDTRIEITTEIYEIVQNEESDDDDCIVNDPA